jgi:hypothetical protein
MPSPTCVAADSAPLAPAPALLAELVRRYWVLGIECGLLEVHKLAWLLDRAAARSAPHHPLGLSFEAGPYGPQVRGLSDLLAPLDGVYLRCETALHSAGLLDVIWFDDNRCAELQARLRRDAAPWLQALEDTAACMDGFESPFGMELLATVDWLLSREGVVPTVAAVQGAMRRAGERQAKVFDDRAVSIALERLEVHHA